MQFLSGPAYLLTREAATAILNTALASPFFPLGDVFLTGLAANRSTDRNNDIHSVWFCNKEVRGKGVGNKSAASVLYLTEHHHPS